MQGILYFKQFPEKCKDCEICFLLNENDVICGQCGKQIDLEDKPDWCKLVEATGYVDKSGNLITWDYAETSVQVCEV